MLSEANIAIFSELFYIFYISLNKWIVKTIIAVAITEAGMQEFL